MEKKRRMANDKFLSLTPDELAALYTTRRAAKQSVINELLHTLDELHRDVLEQVVEQKQQEGFPEANALIAYIKSK